MFPVQCTFCQIQQISPYGPFVVGSLCALKKACVHTQPWLCRWKNTEKQSGSDRASKHYHAVLVQRTGERPRMFREKGSESERDGKTKLLKEHWWDQCIFYIKYRQSFPRIADSTFHSHIYNESQFLCTITSRWKTSMSCALNETALSKQCIDWCDLRHQTALSDGELKP